MLILNDRINNRHKIVQNLNGGNFEGFSNFLKNRGLFFFYYNDTSYFFYNGYIAYYNDTNKSYGLTVKIDNQIVKNAFDAIKHLTIRK
jgi:hypothetical protein